MEVLNNVAAPDTAPSVATTIDGTVGYSRAIIDVANAAIFWQAKTGRSNADAQWLPSNGVYMSPGSRRAPVSGRVFGFRFWAAVTTANLPAGQKQAQVTVTLV